MDDKTPGTGVIIPGNNPGNAIMTYNNYLRLVNPSSRVKTLHDKPVEEKDKKKPRQGGSKDNFNFTSTQKHQNGGKKIVRNVTIKHGKGHKKVSYYRGNKLVRSAKKSLKNTEINMIKLGKFIPGLFRDCNVTRKTHCK